MITIEDILGIDNCIINTYNASIPFHDKDDRLNWREISYPESDSFPYSDLHNIEKYQDIKKVFEDQDIFLIPGYLSYGDYDNSCMVERSNYKIFMEDHKGDVGIFSLYGGYGSTGIAISIRYLLNLDNEEKAQEIIDILNGLNDYPCIDDEDMSNMEYEAFMEALDDYGVRDTIGALQKKFNIDINDYKEKEFKGFLIGIDGCLNYPSYMIESGGICYIDIERLIESITFDQLKPLLTDYEVRS